MYGTYAGAIVRPTPVAGGHGAHAVEDALCASLAGHGVDDDVGAGQGAVHGRSGLADQRAGVLKGEAAGQGEGEVGKVVRTGAAHASLFYSQHAVDLFHLADNAAAGLGGNLIGERADGFAG